MSKALRFFYILLAATLLLFYQNCSKNYYAPIGSLQAKGNGDTYDGKPERTYYRYIPEFRCEGKETFKDSIQVINNKFYLYENQPERCARFPQELKTSDLVLSSFQNDIIARKDFIYTRVAGDVFKPQNSWSEVLCRDDFENPQFELIVDFNESSGQTAVRYYSKDDELNDINSQRLRSTERAEYGAFNGGLKFEVDLNRIASSSAFHFPGRITSRSTEWQSRIATTNLTCITGASLEQRLSLTGKSNFASPVVNRIFTELDSPAWTLTGACNPAAGDVNVKGDIDSTIAVPCDSRNGGEFSTVINYSAMSPFFKTLPGLTREIWVSQASDEERTWLYMAQSTEYPTIVTTNKQLGDMMLSVKDPTVHYILGEDFDLSEGGTKPVNNWDVNRGLAGGPFEGSLDGDGRTISNLDHTSGFWSACLFEWSQNASFKNLNFKNLRLGIDYYSVASTRAAAVVCNSINSTFDNISVEGTIESRSSKAYIGGIVGVMFGGSIARAKVNVSITGSAAAGIGGIAGGCTERGSEGSLIQRSYSQGFINVSNSTSSGGLVGVLYGVTASQIVDSYSTASVGGAKANGGLVGALGSSSGQIKNTYFTGGSISVPSGQLGGPTIGDMAGHTVGITSSYYFPDSMECINCTNPMGIPVTGFLGPKNTPWDFLNIWTFTEGDSVPTLRP